MEITLKAPTKVREVLKKFRLSNREIYIVGGVIRDSMLNRPLYDWDFTTNATPEEMLLMFPDAFYDNKYGTVGVPGNKNDRPYEITTFRAEKGYSDSRHPDEITWGKTLEDDLKRRDFTINAMALKHMRADKFELIDLYGGMEDVKQGLIKTVGDPGQRFAEDALRMMRAVRIATQLRFAIDEETFQAIQANAGNISQVSGERIRDELLKILASDYPADGYLLLRNLGLGEIILPEMEQTFGVEQKKIGRAHV
jgi:tRNA nucleotidyltransferase (CCA-adding enzyme)